MAVPDDLIRHRPAMYAGNLEDGTAQHELLWELVRNAIDEHLRTPSAGYVRIRIDGHRLVVEDDARGIPREDLMPIATLVRGNPKFEAPLRPELPGLGIAVPRALSETLDVEVWRDGRGFRRSFVRGRIAGDFVDTGPTDRRGTRVELVPDFTILTPRPWDLDAIRLHARELAAIQPMTFIVDDEAYRYPDGLADHVRYLTRGRRVAEPVHARRERDGVRVDVALAWVEDDATEVTVLVNERRAPPDTYVDAIFAGLERAFARVLGPAVRDAPLRRGLVAMVHVADARPGHGDPIPVDVREVVERAVAAAIATDPTFDAVLAHLSR